MSEEIIHFCARIRLRDGAELYMQTKDTWGSEWALNQVKGLVEQAIRLYKETK